MFLFASALLAPCFAHASSFAANVRAVQVYNNGEIWAMLCPTNNNVILLGNVNTPAGAGQLSLALKSWESNGTKRLYIDWGTGSGPSDACSSNYSTPTPVSIFLWYN